VSSENKSRVAVVVEVQGHDYGRRMLGDLRERSELTLLVAREVTPSMPNARRSDARSPSTSRARNVRISNGSASSATARSASGSFDGAAVRALRTRELHAAQLAQEHRDRVRRLQPARSNERRIGSKRRASASRDGPARVNRFDKR
jgi:hypothetical protein